MILAVVLVVIALCALTSTAALFYASAQRAASAAAARRAQSRALAWSGVQALLGDLAGQREALLRGERPRWMGEQQILGTRGGSGERGVFRLVRIEGREAVGESGAIDVNSATTETLARAGLGPGLAAEIAAARRGRAFGSLGEVAILPGWASVSASGSGSAAGVSEVGTPAPDRARRGLLERLTVFSFDPQVCGGRHAGEARIDISGGWTRAARREGVRILGRELAGRVGPLMGQAGAARGGEAASAGEGGAGVRPPASLGELLERLVGAGVFPEEALRVVDSCMVGKAPVRTGVVSVYEAPAEVLESLAGLDADAARRIVTARDQVQGEARGSLAWLLEREVLSVEQLAAAIDGLSTRCMQWRVVVESGVVSGSEDGSGDAVGTESGEGEDPAAGALRDRVVLEAVLDVSDMVPRVAYLRDVTNLPAAQWLDAWALAREGSSSATVARTAEQGGPETARAAAGSEAAPAGPVEQGATASGAAARTGTGGSGGSGASNVSGRVGRWTTQGGRR